MLFRMLLATALVVPMFADDNHDRYDRRDNDRNWSRNDRREDRREERIREERIREARRREALRNNGRYNGNYGYGNNVPYGYGNNAPYGYGNNSGYGYRNGGAYGNNSAIVTRTMQDLQSAASRSRVDGHERDHFNRAMGELQNMRYNQVDSGRLSRVLEDLDHLSRADQINPRDRQILARDRQALASSYGGYGYNGW
jgi:hypothetical protein